MIIKQKYLINEQMAKDEWLQYGLTTLENQNETYMRKPQGKALCNSFLTKEKKKELLSLLAPSLLKPKQPYFASFFFFFWSPKNHTLNPPLLFSRIANPFNFISPPYYSHDLEYKSSQTWAGTGGCMGEQQLPSWVSYKNLHEEKESVPWWHVCRLLQSWVGKQLWWERVAKAGFCGALACLQ